MLRPPSAGGEALLAFLDLDMAFDAASFVDLAAGGPTKPSVANVAAGGAATMDGGVPDAEPSTAAAHALLLEREYVNLMEVLAGSDASNGVPQVALSEIERQSAAVQAAGTALTDTLVLAYQAAYAGQAPIAPIDAKLHRCAHALMRLAVIVMAECEA